LLLVSLTKADRSVSAERSGEGTIKEDQGGAIHKMNARSIAGTARKEEKTAQGVG